VRDYIAHMAKKPKAVVELEMFLVAQGLSLVRHEGEGLRTDNVAVYGAAVYSDQRLVVRVEFDRAYWMVLIGDAGSYRDTGYDPAVLREALGLAGGDSTEIEEDVTIVVTHWDRIRDLFAPERRAETHDRLDTLRKQRVHRLFPGW
jgi:hypothetical protein